MAGRRRRQNRHSLGPLATAKTGKGNPVEMVIFKRVYADGTKYIAEERSKDTYPRSVEADSVESLAKELAQFQETNMDELRRRRFLIEWATKTLRNTPTIILPHKNIPVGEHERMEFLGHFKSLRKI